MLQAMQQKVIAEGHKEEQLFDKFKCYCETYSDTKLRKEISANNAKVEEMTSAIEAGKGEISQLKEDLKTHEQEQTAALNAKNEGTSLRKKEADAFAAQDADDKANIAAVKKALAALKKGTEGSFLQTSAAQDLQRLILARQDVNEDDKKDVAAFLSGSQGTAGTDAIIGILEALLESMTKNVADAVAAEQEAIAEYSKLMAAKEKELKVLASTLEEKTARQGELSVELVDMENDLSDAKAAVKENNKLLSGLDKMCEEKAAEFEENKKMRADELAALADTIKILNDDDTLDLFKKTIPVDAGSFLQFKVSAGMMREQALQKIKSALSAKGSHFKLGFVMLALQGKKIGFEKVIKMVDSMVATLKQEQIDDDNKKEYCSKEMDASDDKQKMEELAISNVETAMDNTKESISQLNEEIEALKETIKDVDKSVSDATEQRKEAHADFTELMASDRAAKEVLGFAKNRLNKFYNPKLYVPPPKEELSPEDHIVAGMEGADSFVQLGSQLRKKVPPPPPEAAAAYKKKSGMSTGVIEMIDLLIADLDKEMAQHDAEEKQDQEDYEQVIAQSAEKRRSDSDALDDKEKALSDLHSQLQKHKSDLKSNKKDLGATLQYIQVLHQECDWLLKYFAVRKEARTSEIDAMVKAKAILNGADFALAQTSVQRSLRKGTK